MNPNGNQEISEELLHLLEAPFFEMCQNHIEESCHSTIEFYCIDCKMGFCSNCTERSHKCIRIYFDLSQSCARTSDVQSLINLAGIQVYKSTIPYLVLIHAREHLMEPPKHYTEPCLKCQATLHRDYDYCSIACKVAMECEPGSYIEPDPNQPIDLTEVNADHTPVNF